MASRITDVTRRRLIEGLAATPWYGALNEVEFLARLYDLDALPTTDPRSTQFPTAREDIIQHCIANPVRRRLGPPSRGLSWAFG